MILGGYVRGSLASGSAGSRATLDDLFRRTLARRPHALAIADPPDRASFADGGARRLTYAEAEHIISAIATRLRRLGLQTDAVVGIQVPNIVEGALTVLGVLRAGMIAALLPVLWRQADIAAALGRVGAKVLITCTRAGTADLCEVAMQAAAQIFPIRFVCAYGRSVPDGIVPLDDLLTGEPPEALTPVERSGNPAAHVAVVTWDIAADGLVPVARSHMELIAGSLAVLLEARMEQDARIVSAIPPSSFAGLAATIVPWLVLGGTLALHQPFNPEAFAAQRRELRCDTAIVAGPLVARLAEAGLLRGDGLKTVLGLWRTADRVARSNIWDDSVATLLDLYAFGESALFAVRRAPGGKPAPLSFGVVSAPRGVPGAVPIVELARTETGTVAMRGAMVPQHAFPPGAERAALPFFKVDENGFVDSGFTCRAGADGKTISITGPPPGIAGVGGYRFSMRDLQDTVSQADSEGSIGALPDPFLGHRLAGSASDRPALRQALTERGLNPLVVDAFRERSTPGEGA